MKRPDKIIKWLHVDRTREEVFVDHNGKPLLKYFIELPYWIGKAYNPQYAKLEISHKHPSFAVMMEEENRTEAEKYIKENWSKKLTKMRKMNHNYLLVSVKAKGKDWFKSIEDYENYHKELHELDKKYGLVGSEVRQEEK